jgi:hypothetical protein
MRTSFWSYRMMEWAFANPTCQTLGSLGLLEMKERVRCREGATVHILIADDHAVVRRGLREILAEALPDADVI